MADVEKLWRNSNKQNIRWEFLWQRSKIYHRNTASHQLHDQSKCSTKSLYIQLTI